MAWRMPASTRVLLMFTATAAPTPALPSVTAPDPATVASTLLSRASTFTPRAADLGGVAQQGDIAVVGRRHRGRAGQGHALLALAPAMPAASVTATPVRRADRARSPATSRLPTRATSARASPPSPFML